jgi:hypothetical protein
MLTVAETVLHFTTITHFGTEDAGQEIILEEEEDIKMHLTGMDQEEITITTEQFI